jgi:hypothetical protein
MRKFASYKGSSAEELQNQLYWARKRNRDFRVGARPRIGAPAAVVGLTPFTVYITFSEPVTGFSETDVIVTNGSAATLATISPKQYTVQVTPAGTGNITIAVAGGIAVDDQQKGNTAARSVIVAWS